mmetsp:Transcript_32408/g.28698  ORF Transcript_32408/g.28698 Transcript_32408/m.28698 type:complete len:157 (+) Transcript_32408:25-495(+)
MIFNLLKFFSRLTHMITVGIIGGSAILNFCFGAVLKEHITTNPEKHGLFVKLYSIGGALLIISGIANIFLIRGGKKVEGKYHLWYLILTLKLAIGVLTTPLAAKLARLMNMETWYWDNLIKINFGLILTAYLLSTTAKWFREEIANNFVATKVKGE